MPRVGTIVRMNLEIIPGFLGGQRCSHFPESFPESPKGNAWVVFRGEKENQPKAFVATLTARIAQCRQNPTSFMVGWLPVGKQGRSLAG